MPVAAAASVALLVATVGMWRPLGPDPNAASTAPIAGATAGDRQSSVETLLVTCGPNGTISTSSDQTNAAPDGLRVRVDNRTGTATSLRQQQERNGSASQAYTSALEVSIDIPPGTSDVVLTPAPGVVQLRCGNGELMKLQLQDPHSYYRGGPADLRCNGEQRALDVPDEAFGRGQSPTEALIDAAKKQGWDPMHDTTIRPIIALGYRDAPVKDALAPLRGTAMLRASVTMAREPSASSPGTFVARPEAECSTGYRRTPTPDPADEPPVVTRSGVMPCPRGDGPLWAHAGYGPTPQQAAASLTTKFGDGRLRPVTRWPDEEPPGGGQTWAMEVDGQPVVSITVRPTTPEQAAFAQGFQALPDRICSMSMLQDIGRTVSG